LGKVKKNFFLTRYNQSTVLHEVLYQFVSVEKDTVLIIIILSFRGGRTAWTMLQWWYYNVII